MSGAARASDPATSHDAARSMSDERIGELHRAIIACLESTRSVGATIDEIAEHTNVRIANERRQSLSPRMVELERKGLVQRKATGEFTPSGRPRFETRKGKSGVGQQVWFLTLDNVFS